ncbi:hypothetical protein N9L47_10845 [Rhodobacteraceae bacterium]|nr:hypothetical protein [Paracoccaceae bacterium]
MSLETQVKSDSRPVGMRDDKVVAFKQVLEDPITSNKSAAKDPTNYCEDIDDMWDNLPV